MGILDRVTTTVRATLNSVVDSVEDPNKIMDLEYENMLESLSASKNNLIKVVTLKNQLVDIKNELEKKAERAGCDAQTALDSKKDDDARSLIQRKLRLQSQAKSIDESIKTVASDESKLKREIDDLQSKIVVIRAEKEALKARSYAADATTKIMESVTDTGKSMDSMSNAMDRAKEKVGKKESRVSAINELTQSGVLHDITKSDEDVTESDVDNELAKMKRQ